MAESGMGRGFARDVEAILSILAMQNQDGQVYMYPWETRANLRLAGLRLDKKIPEFVTPEYDWEKHEPEFDPEPESEPEIDYEEDPDA